MRDRVKRESIDFTHKPLYILLYLCFAKENISFVKIVGLATCTEIFINYKVDRADKQNNRIRGELSYSTRFISIHFLWLLWL